METSILAAVGSFVVSEKVIKFKAYIILGLFLTVLYDLSIHTNDPVSLRVYRGPALLALSLICAAFCLRTWRRNGVACDELLFLPGSIYARANSSDNGSQGTPNRTNRLANRLPLNMRNGHGHIDNADQGNNYNHGHSIVAGCVNESGGGSAGDGGSAGVIPIKIEEENRIGIGNRSSSYDKSINSTNLDDGIEEQQMEMVPLTISSTNNIMEGGVGLQDESIEKGPAGGGIDSGHSTPNNVNANSNANAGKTSLWRHIACRSHRFPLRRNSSILSPPPPDSPKRNGSFTNTTNTPSETLPAHQKGTIGGVGGIIAKFFSSSQDSNEYAPSGPAVASASLDLCIPVLFNFHLFIMATNFIPEQTVDSADPYDTAEGDDNDGTSSSIPPQVLPLLFLSILSMRAILPPKSRRRFWGTIKSAIVSPFVGVTFRDELIGEVFTSLVRPMQDLSFALFYYFSSIYGILSGKVGLEDIGAAIEQNLLLHNLVLPICAILPLFCRFLQTLRQAFNDQQRWPHLGNAFKYLTSSLVIIYGLTHAEEGRTICWHLGFVACVVYQLWWDIFVDWELFDVSPHGGNGSGSVELRDELTFLDSTVSSSSSWSNWCSRYLDRIELRPQRLYKSKKKYWHILILNCCIRSCWMLAFIPAYHWNTRTGNMEKTSSVDAKKVMGFLISVAELLRRCCWVILRLELETIKLTDREYTSANGNPYYPHSKNTSSGVSGGGGWNSQVQYNWLMPRGDRSPIVASSTQTQTMAMKWIAYRLLSKKLFCLELFLWVVAYLGLGLCVATLG